LILNDLYGNNNRNLARLIEKLWQEYIRVGDCKTAFSSL
jgi:hypothetical protein